MKDIFVKNFGQRKKNTHKGNYGKALLVAGSQGMTGAAVLASQSSLRSGAGLVTLAVPESLNAIFEIKLTEVMTLPLPDKNAGCFTPHSANYLKNKIDNFDAYALGPGISRKNSTQKFVRDMYGFSAIPCVLDADGLNAFEGCPEKLAEHTGPIIITPHEGEWERVFSITVRDHVHKVEEAKRIAQLYDVIVVFKGHHTIVANPTEEVYVNKTGNPGMATAGTGDCLVGIIVAFLARGIEPTIAAQLAVFLHGYAGDIASEKMSEESMIASDLIDAIPVAFKDLLQ